MATTKTSVFRVGLISDTHGLLRASAIAFLRDCDHILHAGDIGGAVILQTLASIAPLTAIRGNNDIDAWATAVPETTTVTLRGKRVFLIHDLKQLRLDPAAAGIDVVMSGHSHRAAEQRRDGVLYVNPGSSGPRRFRLPISLGELRIDSDAIAVRFIELAE